MSKLFYWTVGGFACIEPGDGTRYDMAWNHAKQEYYVKPGGGGAWNRIPWRMILDITTAFHHMFATDQSDVFRAFLDRYVKDANPWTITAGAWTAALLVHEQVMPALGFVIEPAPYRMVYRATMLEGHPIEWRDQFDQVLLMNMTMAVRQSVYRFDWQKHVGDHIAENE